MNRFKSGFFYLLSGFKLILKPGIRMYVIIPLLINTLLFTGAIIYGASQLEGLINWLISQWEWIEWIKWLLWPLFVIIALIIVFFTFSLVANLIGAPFNGFLAEAVEKFLTGQDVHQASEISLLQEIRGAFKSELQKFLYFIIRAIPLLILFIVPMVNFVAPIIWFLFSAWMLVIEYMDYPMGNHQILFADQRKKLSENKQLAFGFGLGVMVLTFIPVINFLVMPVAVAGATRMLVEHRSNFLTSV